MSANPRADVRLTLVFAGRSSNPAVMPYRRVLATLFTVPAFAAAGALSRYAFRTTETRRQIAAFATLAASVEVVASHIGHARGSLIRCTLNIVAAAILIVSVKFHLEPDARRHGHEVFRDAVTLIFSATDDRP